MQRIFILLLCIPFVSRAQFPEDALRYGYPNISGTARNLAIGGAMGSLGGDITAAHINPAGIGLYKNNEVVLTPGFQFANNNFEFLDETTKSKKSNFNYGTSGFVFGSMNGQGRKATSKAFSISINQIANYNNRIRYQGANNQSSWSEQYVEQLVRDGVDNVFDVEQNYVLGASLAFFTFLVDGFDDSLGNLIGYQSLVPLSPNGSTFINQINQIDTRGGAHELSFAFANNYSDKFYLGGSLNLPIYSFQKEQIYREEDLSGNRNNDFDFFEYRESSRTTGIGINGKMGLIFKPVSKVRLGLAFHTPTVAGMTDRYSTSITTDTELYTSRPQPITETSDNLIRENQLNGSTNPDRGIYEYNLTTPYRFVGSASFVFNEVKDIRKQKGFLTADIEYVNHRGTRFNAIEIGDEAYYQGLNNVIRENYKGAFNLKLGGEVKFEKIMARAGFATYGNPYSDKTGLQSKRNLLSGGLGYRHFGMFIDLTYVHTFITDVHIPYFLEDKPNPVADASNSRGLVMLTVGFKL
jgi:hypothetical protein